MKTVPNDSSEPAGYTPPPVPYFTVSRRNYGHWDIWDNKGRIFAVRGGPGKYYIRDERRVSELSPREWPEFKTLGSLMGYLCEELMYENLAVEGREPHVIEPWNI